MRGYTVGRGGERFGGSRRPCVTFSAITPLVLSPSSSEKKKLSCIIFFWYTILPKEIALTVLLSISFNKKMPEL